MTGIFQKDKVLQKVLSLPVDEIVPNPAQPRQDFEEQELQELAASIRENGLLQPIIVRRNRDRLYELISGERRLRAAKMAGLSEIPAVMMNTTARQSAIYAILENIQRKDLTLFEEALALRCLINEWGVTQEEAAEKLGKAQSTIANKLRLLSLSNVEQDIITAHQLSERHARAVLKIKDEAERLEILKYVAANGLNVSQTEQYIEKKLRFQPTTRRRMFIVKDVRIFLNTINRAIDTMKNAGIDAQTTKRESGQYIEYVVRIPMSPHKIG